MSDGESEEMRLPNNLLALPSSGKEKPICIINGESSIFNIPYYVSLLEF
jgi:hypothetical protein